MGGSARQPTSAPAAATTAVAYDAGRGLEWVKALISVGQSVEVMFEEQWCPAKVIEMADAFVVVQYNSDQSVENVQYADVTKRIRDDEAIRTARQRKQAAKAASKAAAGAASAARSAVRVLDAKARSETHKRPTVVVM